MAFPPIPGLTLPPYLFFIITPACILLGFLLSLLLFTNLRKWLVIIIILLPIPIIVTISPLLDIMTLTLSAYVFGFVSGSLVFFLIFMKSS